jgi:hypothetical protein
MWKSLRLLFLFSLIISGCQSANNEEVTVEMNLMDLPPPLIEGDSNADEILIVPGEDNKVENSFSDSIGNDKKWVKEGKIRLEAIQPSKSAIRIKASVVRLGGYISKENEYLNDYEKVHIHYTVHIPSQQLDNFLGGFEKMDSIKMTSKSISILDITSQYVDTESRITSKKQQLEAYTSLLPKAVSVSDIIAVERERKKVQEDLDAHIARLSTMKNQIAYSTLEIHIKESQDNTEDKTFLVKTSQAFLDSLNSITELFYFIIRNWFWLLPLLVLSLFSYRKIRHRIQ